MESIIVKNALENYLEKKNIQKQELRMVNLLNNGV